jgi:superfamily II DNA or RNA helicase
MSGFEVGTLVQARGREWVVLPESAPDLLILRPLGGADEEIAGILPELEPVESATFSLPDPAAAGDARSARLLRDALRLGFRSSAGPFRSFGRITVEPRPYQLVPLLMALKLDPVRLLIADDVGIGKTVEAGLIARELLDRGEVARLAVLCPPHLAEQWQAELATKFGIDAKLVLPSTARRMERGLAAGESLFDAHPHVIVSTDFIKTDARRDDFVRTCPEMVIVDEAHTFAFAGPGRHQRHELLSTLAADEDRNLILVTATPHSGKEDAFRSLLVALDDSFRDLPEDLSGQQMEGSRRRLARHLVQRRRADIRAYLDESTPFPERLTRDESYQLTPEQRQLFDRAIGWARDTIGSPDEDERGQRIRWWSALALLRSLGSSPMAAAETLRTRADNLTASASASEADAVGRRAVLDDAGEDGLESLDVVLGSLAPDESTAEGDAEAEERRRSLTAERRRLLEMANQVEALSGTAADPKLAGAVEIVEGLLAKDCSPIVFCRFIATAEYVAQHLQSSLGKETEVIAVTGRLAPSEREHRVDALAAHPRRVLVTTDCLSEGINLQEHFDSVVHYDLAWNPTRHEQREGRVDRFGQDRPEVHMVTYLGSNSPIDGIVLEVLLRKHETIRKSLGISVPIPVDAAEVADAIFEGLITRGRQDESIFEQLQLYEDVASAQKRELHDAWDRTAAREKRTQTMFAQRSIKVEQVKRELDAARAAISSGADAERFAADAIVAHGGHVKQGRHGGLVADISDTTQAFKDAVGAAAASSAMEIVRSGGALKLNRAHPVIGALASFTLDTALGESPQNRAASRCGAIITSAVQRRTVLLLLRLRIHLEAKRKQGRDSELLVEEAVIRAFTGSAAAPAWLSEQETEALLDAAPAGNVAPDQARTVIARQLAAIPELQPRLDEIAESRTAEALAAHRRVRAEAKRDAGLTARPQLPGDVLGLYVYLPVAAG